MPGEQEPPPYEVLAALVASLRRELAEMAGVLARARTELAGARERTAGLEARRNQNPRNSSKPPSGEGLARPAPKPRSLRKPGGRKPGGQDGHKGAALTQAARPDREIRHEPACRGRCGTGLADRPVTAVERRQVFDLQPVRAEVTGHQLIERECGCGYRTKATAPAGAEAPVQYGPRIAAVIVCLYAGQFLSKDRTAQALAELSGIPLSSGTVAALTARAAGQPASYRGMLTQLRDLGLPMRTARNSALRQLVLQVPAPVIAGALGFHHTTTTRQHINAGATWSQYAANRDRDWEGGIRLCASSATYWPPQESESPR